MQPEIFALRYEVYCLEYGFLDAKKYRDGLESDEYDTGAAHFMAHNRKSELVGSLRLVHPPLSQKFPFEEWCYDLFDSTVLPPREECAEISRLVVRKSYRGLIGNSRASAPEEFSIVGPVGPAHRRPHDGEQCRYSPQILLGLYREMYKYSLERGIRYWYAAMERSLARALTRFQAIFVPIGKEVDYYGPVTPYLLDLRAWEARLQERNPKLRAWFRGELQRL